MTDNVRPMDLSNLLKHAFLSGIIAARNIPADYPCDGPKLWTEYDPDTADNAYTRVRNALEVGRKYQDGSL